MSPGETQQLKLALLATAAYYSNPLRDEVLNMIVDDLEDLPFSDIARALKEIRRDPKVTRFPLSAQIRQRIAPELTEQQEAREIAARAVGAVSKYGYCNTLEAQAYIGEFGWNCISLMGGWYSFCQGLTDFNITQFQAQLRELAETQIVTAKAEGKYLEMKNSRPELPPVGEFRPFETRESLENIRRMQLQHQAALLKEGRASEAQELQSSESRMKSAAQLIGSAMKGKT